MSEITRAEVAHLARLARLALEDTELDRLAKVDPPVHAFLHVDTAGGLDQARRVDAGEVTGPLAGVPLALKDVIVQKGVPTTVGSRILEGWRPPYDATIVTRLKAAGV